jgi:hypothetical protein
MPTKIELVIEDVDIAVDPNSPTDEQIVTLTLRYSGSQNLAGQIVQGELLDIEVPSHAPPPLQKGKKKGK